MADQHALTGPPRRDGAVRWWDLLLAFFGGNFLGAVLAIAVGVCVALAADRIGLAGAVQGYLASLRTDFWTNMSAILFTDGGLLAAVWFVARWRFESPAARFFSPVAPKTLLACALGGIGLSAVLNGGNLILERLLHVPFRETAVERALEPHGLPQIAGALFAIALFAPLVEEFFFRGLLFAWIDHRLGVAPAIGLSAVAFSAAHGHFYVHPGIQGWVFTGELFLAGLVLAIAAVRAGSLRASYIVHAAYNAGAVLLGVWFP